MEESGFDPKRRLCPDGSCVGIMGADGRCSVCGHAKGAPAEPNEAGAADSSSQAPDPMPSGFDPGRRLCDDGSCVGIVGADGVCGACGQRAG
jgi:hypothetical protein